MAFRMPAEWAPHESVWIGFPSFVKAWGEPLHRAQQQIAAFANAVHASGRGERVHVIAGSAEAAKTATDLVDSGVCRTAPNRRHLAARHGLYHRAGRQSAYRPRFRL